MDWLVSLFTENSIAHDILVYAVVIAMGVLLGKIKFFGVSLGATFVLFVGIVSAHFHLTVGSADLLNFIRDFGLILFVFSIGIQVGPGFFSSFKRGGMQMNLLATIVIFLNVAVALGIYYMNKDDVTIPQIVGILSGAVTNTPGLGAAQQALDSKALAGADDLSMGYAAAYPLGVVGIILSMILLKVIFKIKVENETKAIEDEKENSQLKPYAVTFKVENRLIEGKNIEELHKIIDHNFVVSRMKSGATGEIIIPTSKTVVSNGDLLLIVCSAQDEPVFSSVIGSSVDEKLETLQQSGVVSRRILVTKSHYNGRTLGSLRLQNGYNLNATRVNRAGVDLLASPNLTLQVGDRLTVVGDPNHIERLATRLGNSMKRLHEPNMVTMFVGIFLGIIVGSIPIALPNMSASMKLGLAGGPLVVAILLSRFGYKLKLVTYTSSSASLMLREIGICLFLASVGLGAGEKFAETVFNSRGALWVLWGFLITVIPLVVVSVIARAKYKFNYLSIIGLMAGSYTDPPALAYSNKVANNDAPAVAYSTVYPLSMFLRVITAQLMILIFA